MAHAEKCPVCEGNGKRDSKDCHGCNGRGWVTVGGDHPLPPPMYPPAAPPPWIPPPDHPPGRFKTYRWTCDDPPKQMGTITHDGITHLI